MNGSRTNPNVEKDIYQDYDIGFDIEHDFDRSYTWLMLFKDGNHIDLGIQIKEKMLEEYTSDKLTVPLLDKDNCLP